MRIAVIGLISAAFLATSASATVYVPGDPQFQVVPETGYTVFNAPVIDGFLGVNVGSSGTYTDDFEFTIPQSGFGSGSVTTTANLTTSSNFINFLSVTFNGTPINISTISLPSGGVEEAGGLTNVPVTVNVLNTLEVKYTSQGAGSYGGQLTFDRVAVPEPTTWATFLLGFAILGFVLRRKEPKLARIGWSHSAA